MNVGWRDEGFVIIIIIILENLFKLYWYKLTFELNGSLKELEGIKACFYLYSRINSIQLSPLSYVISRVTVLV